MELLCVQRKTFSHLSMAGLLLSSPGNKHRLMHYHIQGPFLLETVQPQEATQAGIVCLECR